MIVADFPFWPVGTALWQRLDRFMDIVLHLGAHRTGSTTLQAWLRGQKSGLETANIGFWGPRRTRKGLFDGLQPGSATAPGKNPQKRAEKRVQMNVARSRQSGLQALIVSDENILGSVRANIRTGMLYPAAGERVARVARAFAGQIDRIFLSVRSQDAYWQSALSYGVMRGHPVPGAGKLGKIAKNGRSWKHVVADIACAAPDIPIHVMAYENHMADPDKVLRLGAGLQTGLSAPHDWLNRAPKLDALRAALSDRGQDPDLLPDGDGRWMPFDDSQQAALQEAFADDIFWLTAGADGLATLTEETADMQSTGKSRPWLPTRGHKNDQEGRLDKAG